MTGDASLHGLQLEVRDVCFAYRRGGERVLNRVNLTLEPAAVTVVTGVSGAGKSTLLYVLALLLRATLGTVWWDGQSVESLTDAGRSHLRAARSGFMFQDALLDPSRTVVDNVAEGALFSGLDPTVTAWRVQSLLDRFGVCAAYRKPAREKPYRLDYRSGRPELVCPTHYAI